MATTQSVNIAWVLSGSNKDGRLLHYEEWLTRLAKSILKDNAPRTLNLLADTSELSKGLCGQRFDVILVAPPHEKRCLIGLESGGLLVVCHEYMVPNPKPTEFSLVKRVFIGSSTCDLLRVATYFQKEENKNDQ